VEATLVLADNDPVVDADDAPNGRNELVRQVSSSRVRGHLEQEATAHPRDLSRRRRLAFFEQRGHPRISDAVANPHVSMVAGIRRSNVAGE
jgi:hypothetical protein